MRRPENKPSIEAKGTLGNLDGPTRGTCKQVGICTDGAGIWVIVGDVLGSSSDPVHFFLGCQGPGWGESVVEEPEAASIPPVRPLSSAVIGLVRVEGELQSRTAGKEEGAGGEEGRRPKRRVALLERSGYKGSLVKGRRKKLEAMVLRYGEACESVGKLQYETRGPPERQRAEHLILSKPASAATLHVLARLAGRNVPSIPSQLQPGLDHLEPEFESSPSS
ncbi:hypothetical protein CGRA01v4_09005 [Colletotrichum graminicola]|nr:hypothetical protein CGRA01v4_09005 [Colletotrichum graminicola]